MPPSSRARQAHERQVEADRAKAEAYWDEATEIVRKHIPMTFKRTTNTKHDLKMATDMIVGSVGQVDLALRVRDVEAMARFRYDVTIRKDRPSGVKCEWEKVMLDGCASHYIYGFAQFGRHPLIGWRFLNLDAIRRQFRDAPDSIRIQRDIRNHDNSSTFDAIDTRSLAPNCTIAAFGVDYPFHLVSVEPLHFIDGTLPTGHVVECVEPTESEARGGRFTGGLRDDEERDPSGSPWGVILWRGSRRRVPMRSFARDDGTSAQLVFPHVSFKPTAKRKVDPTPDRESLVASLIGIHPDELRQLSDEKFFAIVYAKGVQLVPTTAGEWVAHGGLSLRELAAVNFSIQRPSLAVAEWIAAQKSQSKWRDLLDRREAVADRLEAAE